MRALAMAATSEAVLAERPRAGGVVEALSKVLHPELLRLAAAGETTGAARHGKFVQEGKAFTMTYGDLSTVGSPPIRGA
jgi:hypothetical protein